MIKRKNESKINNEIELSMHKVNNKESRVEFSKEVKNKTKTIKDKKTRTLNEKQENIKKEILILKLTKRNKIYNTITGILFIIYNIITFIEVELFISQEYFIHKKFISTNTNTILRIVAMAITFPNYFLIYGHYCTKLQIEKILNLRTVNDSFKTTGMLKYIIIEYLLISLVTYPYLDYSFEINQLGKNYVLVIDAILFFIGLFRNYILLRLYSQYSRWNNKSSTLICKKNKCKPNMIFVLKCELNYRPYFVIFILIVCTILIFGFALRNFE